MKISRLYKYLYRLGLLLLPLLALLLLLEIFMIPTKIVKEEDGLHTYYAGEEVKEKDSMKETKEPLQEKEKDMIREKIKGMTLEEKLAQLFVVTPEALSDDKAKPVTELDEALAEGLKKYPVGGFIFFNANMTSKEQTMKLLKDLENASPLSPFLSVDEEGGSVARVAKSGLFDTTVFSDMGNIKTEEEAKAVGLTIGKELREIGFNLDFAPVADVNSNPDNKVIGKRAFSSDPDVAKDLLAACVKGFKESGILSTLKHFPGHGDTRQDSHETEAVTDKSLQELKKTCFPPFMEGISAGADLVMAGHIVAADLDDKPASLSEILIAGVLRSELGYEGLVITDALNMGAVTRKYSAGEAAVLSIKAGCDLLLMPEDFYEAFDGLLTAVRDGSLSEARIDQSLMRILEKKVESGIMFLE